jgi:hypothetical protein
MPTARALPRSRLACGTAAAATIALALASRRFPGPLAEVFGKYPADALWTVMMFWMLAATWPRASSTRLAVGAFAVSAAVEFLKLWQAPWLVEIRYTTAGHLVFGHVFSWQNLVAYAFGALLAGAIDKLLATAPRPAAPSASHA